MQLNKMERKTFIVKIEPEEDLEYNLHHVELENKSEIDRPIKPEECLEEEIHDYQQPEFILLPSIKEELPIYQESLNLSNPLENYGTSQTVYKELISRPLQTNRKISKCKEDKCPQWDRIVDRCIRHGGIRAKKISYCKEEGCSNKAKSGGKCIRHGGVKATCKHEGCSKNAKRGGKNADNSQQLVPVVLSN
uniref:Uncharacterized protein n=1 Tax=Timema poppense TaxID=170557 RepID=A0A7R9DAI5_TIMPO|nr:unnamed protein product [Timema poppensis]